MWCFHTCPSNSPELVSFAPSLGPCGILLFTLFIYLSQFLNLCARKVCSFKTSVSAYKITCCHIPEDYSLIDHCCENLGIHFYTITAMCSLLFWHSMLNNFTHLLIYWTVCVVFSLAGHEDSIDSGCNIGNCAQQKFELFEAFMWIANQPILQCSEVALAYRECSQSSTGNRWEALLHWHCRYMAYLGNCTLNFVNHVQ